MTEFNHPCVPSGENLRHTAESNTSSGKHPITGRQHDLHIGVNQPVHRLLYPLSAAAIRRPKESVSPQPEGIRQVQPTSLLQPVG